MLLNVENTNGLNMTGKVKDNNNIGVLSLSLTKINVDRTISILWLSVQLE